MSQQDSAPGTLHPLGYHEPHAEEQLHHLMSDSGMLLIDIRYRARAPYSRVWTKKALTAAYPERYLHMRDLGNINYQNPQLPIQLANPLRVLPQCVGLLQAGFSLVLLCACKEYEQCHRKMVYELLTLTRTASQQAEVLAPHVEELSEYSAHLAEMVHALHATPYPLARLHLTVNLAEALIRRATVVRHLALDAALTFAEIEQTQAREQEREGSLI